MTTGRASTQRATPRPTHGDVTGNATINLGKEHQAAVREAQARMSTVSPAYEEVYDISDDAEAQRQEVTEEQETKTEDLSRTGLNITALPRERARKMLRSVSKKGERDPEEPVEVRFIDDFPGVTLGKNPDTGELRTFDFEAGRKYRVPLWVAEHFSDKEMLV